MSKFANLKPGQATNDGSHYRTCAGVLLKNTRDWAPDIGHRCHDCVLDKSDECDQSKCYKSVNTRWVKVEAEAKVKAGSRIKPGHINKPRTLCRTRKGVLLKNMKDFDSDNNRGCQACALYNTSCDGVVGWCQPNDRWTAADEAKPKTKVKPKPVKVVEKLVPYEFTPIVDRTSIGHASITTATGNTVNITYFPAVDGKTAAITVEMLSKPKPNGTRTKLEFKMTMEGARALIQGCSSLGLVQA